MKAIFLNERNSAIDSVYPDYVKKRLYGTYEFPPEYITPDKFGKYKEYLADTEYIFSTWGMPALTKEQIEKHFPRLKAVFYAAGSVRGFAEPFLLSGIKVFGARQANAIPVAEYVVSQILLAGKGFFQAAGHIKEDFGKAAVFCGNFKGNFKAKVGIIEAGAISFKVMEELVKHGLEIFLYSGWMTEKEAKSLGVKLASLEQIFSECGVISNHLADTEETAGLIDRKLIFSMTDYSAFINTGRGRQVDHDALADKLESNPTVTALLDVTYPEPLPKGSKLLKLPNVFITPHIAGSKGNEVWRMSEYMLDESVNLTNGKGAKHEITTDMLKYLA